MNTLSCPAAKRVFRLFLLLPLLQAGAVPESESAATRSVQAALDSFDLAPGFQIELIASEPLVSDPVAMEIDENGVLYVLEMHGYPLDTSGSGYVKTLHDTDGDGRMDESRIFAEGLLLPTGIMRWKNGVLVTDPPNVVYLEDTNGDGQADRREVVLTGFAVSNPQHNMNTPLLGLDNWIYLAHEPVVTAKVYAEEFGDRGSEVHYPQRPDGPRLAENAAGRSVRFRPDSFELESTSSKTQFGHTFDEWGRRFLVSNANHIYHEVIAAPYLQRAPDLPVASATHSISDHGAAAEVFPITRNAERQLLTDAGVFTSACGLTAYAGGLFPETFRNVTFVAEPVNNLVHADRLRGDGATFTASRVYEDREFLASTDPWFRPVNMYIGPDGALYLMDYYRQIIEHPEWMAEEAIQSGALYNGKDMGRIYRISPKGSTGASWTKSPLFRNATEQLLVESLNSPNIWWRRHAQRLLLDRRNPQALPTLEALASNANAPLGRIHALWTLQGLDRLPEALIVDALSDASPGVRENAIQIAEIRMSESPEIATALQQLQNDPEARVRYQALCSLGFLDTPRAAQARETILFKDIEDPWVQIAALTARSLNSGELLEAVLTQFQPGVPAYASLVDRLSSMEGASGEADEIRVLIRRATDSKQEDAQAWQAAILQGLGRGLKGKTTTLESLRSERELLVRTVFDHDAAPVRSASIALLEQLGLPDGRKAKAALERAARLASDGAADLQRRTEAIRFLALQNPAASEGLFKRLMIPAEPLQIQRQALDSLSSIRDLTVSQFVLEKWPTLTPELRDAAVDTFFASDQRIALLLDALEGGRIQPSSVGWRRSVRLMAHGNEALRTRARALLSKRDEGRQQVIADYQDAMGDHGDYENGRAVFMENCAMCHRMGDEAGAAFGPDLGMMRNRSRDTILADILNPNRAIADGFDLWMLELVSGETLQGVVSAESPSALTLLHQSGAETTVPRQDLQSLAALGISAMPSGLESSIDPQQMADLIAFIKGETGNAPTRAEERASENLPQRVHPDEDGVLRLTAETGRASGPEIKYMPEWQAFGWFTARDRVEWEAEVTQPGVYEVWLEWSVSDEEAGKLFVFTAGSERLTGTVKRSGSWETFRTEKIGSLRLPEGRQTMVFKPDSDFKEGALLDLRAITLRPTE